MGVSGLPVLSRGLRVLVPEVLGPREPVGVDSPVAVLEAWVYELLPHEPVRGQLVDVYG